MALISPRFSSNTRLQAAANNNPAMNWGEVGDPVRMLQQALIDLGAKMPISIQKHGSPDGIFGDETKSAVSAFQGKHGLTPDGIAGKNTWTKLDALFKTSAAVSLSPLPAGSFIRNRFKIVFRSTAIPIVPEDVALENARKVYGMYGFQIDEGAGMSLALDPAQTITLETIDGACLWDEENEDQKLLFAAGGGRAGVGLTDIMVYYVNKIQEPTRALDGCAGHKPGAPAVVVAATATKFAMGHECGHVLLGSHFVPDHTKSKANLMFEGFLGDLTADPPGLLESQVRAMRNSKFVTKA